MYRTLSILFILVFGISCAHLNSTKPERASFANLPTEVAHAVDSLQQIEEMFIQKGMIPGILAETQGQIGLLLFERLPEEGIRYFEKVISYNYDDKQWTKAAELHTFVARIYDEKLNDSSKALEQLLKAEVLWEQLHKKSQSANVLQYQGLLEAKLGRLTAGKSKIRSALIYFDSLNYIPEKGEACLNLARVFHLEDQVDSSLAYLDRAQESWISQDAPGPLFNINNLKLRILLENDRLEAAAKVQLENETLMKQHYFHWTFRLTFFQLSYELSQKNGQSNELEIMQERYQLLKDSLKTEALFFSEEI